MSPERPTVPVRSNSGRGPAPDTVERIVEATLVCLRRDGRDGTTVAAISRESGLSRQTIYARFLDLDSLVSHAVEQVALDLAARLVRRPRPGRPVARELVELLVVLHREFRSDPVAMLVLDLTLEPQFPGSRTFSGETLRLTEEFVRGVVRDHPGYADQVAFIAETSCRWLLSLLTYESAYTASDARLRAYLGKALLPIFERLAPAGS